MDRRLNSAMPNTSHGLQDFDILTLREVAAALHCSRAHVSNVIAGHVPGCSPIPSVHLARRMLVRRESILTWIPDMDS
jgi:hypothetical protein